MLEIILSFLVFLIVVLAMSIGISFGRQALQGSCGGLNKIPGIKSDCNGLCRSACPNRKKQVNTK